MEKQRNAGASTGQIGNALAQDCCGESAPPSLADQLRERRTRILRESQQKIRKIDSALRMLEQTDAEKSVADAKEVLSDVW